MHDACGVLPRMNDVVDDFQSANMSRDIVANRRI